MKAHPRSGTLVTQLEGYRAFEPTPLPPSPRLQFDDALLRQLVQANLALGRLDGLASTLPGADLFLSMYVRHEALVSSRIEGTQCTLDDVVAAVLSSWLEDSRDVGDVVRYVAALNHGVARLGEFPLSMRLVREMHEVLLRDGRGSEKTPGEFRRTQNWIGPAGCTLADARFVPPPVHVMKDALGDLEMFLHDESLSALLVAGLAHAQFETIHPFLDGNGRTGRLLIALILHDREVLCRPILYLSAYFKEHQREYYRRLTSVREDGDWEGWMAFFLSAVTSSATHAAHTAMEITRIHAIDRELVVSSGGNKHDIRLLDALYSQPIVNVAWVERELNVSKVTANRIVARLESLGILRETTGFSRNRRFRYDSYLRIFEAMTPQ